jgi:hypothetical protein
VTLSSTLTHDSRLAKTQASDVMAVIVAERIVDRPEAANFVVMRRPGRGHAPPLGKQSVRRRECGICGSALILASRSSLGKLLPYKLARAPARCGGSRINLTRRQPQRGYTVRWCKVGGLIRDGTS